MPNQWWNKRCYGCHKLGHIHRFCRNTRFDQGGVAAEANSFENVQPMRQITFQEADFRVTIRFYSVESKTIASIEIKKDGRIMLQQNLI